MKQGMIGAVTALAAVVTYGAVTGRAGARDAGQAGIPAAGGADSGW